MTLVKKGARANELGEELPFTIQLQQCMPVQRQSGHNSHPAVVRPFGHPRAYTIPECMEESKHKEPLQAAIKA